LSSRDIARGDDGASWDSGEDQNMPLIVEDGSGRSDAESYASVTGAIAYFGGIVTSAGAAFLAATPTRQEQALRAGTMYLDGEYGERWKGDRMSSAQRLYWPRNNVEIDDFIQPVAPLPRELVEATYEAAARDVVGGTSTLMADVTPEGKISSKSVSVGQGAVAKAVTYSGGARATSTSYPKIASLVLRLIRPAGLVRA
jgi:hypothetical protein